MPWVRFVADMDWKPKPSVTIAYAAGSVLNVPSPAAAAAVARGKAVRMIKAGRHAPPVESDHDS